MRPGSVLRSLLSSGLTLLLLGLLLGACDVLNEPPRAVGTLERDRIRLISDSNEPILNILVKEGDRVESGQLLLEQSTERIQAQFDHASALERAAFARLAEAEKGPRAQQIEQARARFSAASSNVRTTQLEVDRTQSLVERNFLPKNRLDVLQGQLEEAIARREESVAALDQLQEGTRSEEIDRARADYAAARTGVTDLQISLDRAQIRAPHSATIEVLPYEAGERPNTGAVVAILRTFSPTYARVHIPEPLRTQLTSGADANVWIDGFDQPFPAKIRWISSEAAFTPFFALTQHDRSHLSYLAEIDLIDPPDLPVGVPVEVRFPGLE